MNDEFADIPGYEGTYKASSFGYICSAKTGSRLAHYMTNSGYQMVSLSKCGQSKKMYVHRAICMAFHGQPSTGCHEVAHCDGSKINNRPENLRWATRRENFSDKKLHGTEALGEKHGRHKLKEHEVLEIRARHSAGELQKNLAIEFGVQKMTVSRLIRKINWAHI